MLISQIPDRLPIWKRAGKAYTLIGHSGIGKTAMMLQAPDILFNATGKKIGIVIFNAATYTVMHMLGFGVVKHFEQHSEMIFSDPFFFRTTVDRLRLSDYPDGGIIFIDEIDKADPDLAKNIGELSYSHQVGAHRLPPGWDVWMAGNPADARYGSKKQLDYLINRQCIIPMRADPEGWNDWGAANRLTAWTLAWARNNQGTVFANELPKVQGPWVTPRSLTQWDEHLRAAMHMTNANRPPEDDILMEECEGFIGAAGCKSWFVQVRQALGMPTLAEILADPQGCRLPSADCMALLCYNTAFGVDVKTLGKVITYIERLPREFSTTFMRAAVQRNPKLIISKELGSWAQKHAQLLTLFNTYTRKQIN